MMESFLKNLDIFWVKIELYLNQQSKSTTVIGGILCIIVMTLIFTATWVIGNDIFYKQQPSIVIQNQLMSNRPALTLDKFTYPISIVMQGMEDNVPFYDEKYFSYSVSLIIVNNTDSTITSIPYNLELCTYDHFPNLPTEKIDKAGILRYYCIKNQNITIYGYWDETINAYMNIRLSFCEGDKCAPKEEILGWFKNNMQLYTWNVYVQNSLVDNQNYTDPVTNYILNKYKLVNDDSHKLYELYLQKINVITDEGVLFEDFSTKTTFAYEYGELDSGPIGSDGSLFDMNIYASNNVINYKRKYIKAQAIAANIGGIIQALMIAGRIITYYFSVIKKNTELVNHILEFECDEKIQIPKGLKFDDLRSPQKRVLPNSSLIKDNTNARTDLKLNPLPEDNNNNILIINNNRNERSNFQKKVSRNINPKDYFEKLTKEKENKKLNFSFSEVVRLILLRPCLRKNLLNKKRLYDLSLSPLYERIDLINIINKLEELEKLKLVLFNKPQLALFNFISKEKIVLDNGTNLKSAFPINELYKYIKDKDQLASVVLQYKYKPPEELTQVDLQLLELLDEMFKFKNRGVKK